MTPIPEYRGVTRAMFESEILPASEPIVMRGLAADWPLVRAGLLSPQALWDYLRPFDLGYALPSMTGPPSIRGRFFYNDDLTGFNFRHGAMKLASAFDFLLMNLDDDAPPTLAIQSVTVRAHTPRLEPALPMPLLDNVEPRLWIGNAGIVATHQDPSENIACVAAGRRRFTLFPPDQLPNLYMGPHDLTPAGTAISLVSLENPDLERFPRFARALETARTAELSPGDAIYIPYMWWHHVRSFERLNMLVNYWWESPAQRHGSPRDAMLHALMTIKNLPPQHREAWRAQFEHYVFETDGPCAEHVPPARRGVLGELSPSAVQALRKDIAHALLRDRS